MRIDERGITLVEVLAAAAIIGIALAGLLTVIPIASYGLQEGNQLSTATFLAEQKLEEVRNATWTANPPMDCLGAGASAAPTSTTCTRTNPTACTSGTTCTTFPNETSVSGYPSYGRTVRITDCAATACAGITHTDMRLVTVTVTYTPLTGIGVATSAKSMTLSLLIAKR